ncbi:MAG: CARDB domain-containing protein, partial [Candidatus Bathyarchaeia archaeon]
LSPSSTEVTAGESVNIDVTVANEGAASETFDLTAYYDGNIIETRTNVALVAGASTTLTLTWNTTGVPAGDYTISASVTVVAGETDTADNTFTDATITVLTVSEAQAFPLWIIGAARYGIDRNNDCSAVSLEKTKINLQRAIPQLFYECN